MILYFSGTGNSKYVAEKLALATNERIFAIDDCIKFNNYNFLLSDNENLGIVCPTYFWQLPDIMVNFLKEISVNATDNYIYFISTYGMVTGQSFNVVRELLKRKGLKLKAAYSVKMPDIWTPVFDLSNKKRVEKINKLSDIEIENIIDAVREKKEGNFQKNRMPRLISKFVYSKYESARKTKHFSVSDKCIGCGMCANKCPVGAIEIRDGKPVWKIEKCTMCLGCLHRCPKAAISYDNKTNEHGQYTNPNVKL